MKKLIRSLLDNDLYKFTMMMAVYFLYPKQAVEYSFTNRGKTPFPTGFADLLRGQIHAMSRLRLTKREERYLRTCPHLRFFRSEFIDYLRDYRLDPSEVEITEDNGAITVTIRGPWLRTILWEVPILAIISELYYLTTREMYKEQEFETRLRRKQNKLLAAGCKFADMGTRRRYSFLVQDKLVRSMKERCGANFIGTSNVYLAMKYDVKPIGTQAHEWIMFHQAMFGAKLANKKALEAWYLIYQGALGIALTDTFTSDVFFRDFDLSLVTRYSGLRQDSGDPIAFGEKAIAFYLNLGIDPMTMTLVFSDALDADKAAELQAIFGGRINIIFGIGTFFTNDVGLKALNIVIKMSRALIAGVWIITVKLSDAPGKWNGGIEAVTKVRAELGLAN